MLREEFQDGLLTLTFNRPERRNALCEEMTLALVDAARRAFYDHEIRAVLLRGAGGYFSVGGDVERMASGTGAPTVEQRTNLTRSKVEISRLLYRMPKPVIAMIDGAVAGAALGIALACDFRIASESAKILTGFARMAMAGDYGGSYFLPKLIGDAKARELYLLSPVLSGREACDLGIVNRVVADADLEREALDFAMSLARGPTIAYGYIKTNLANAQTMTLEQCLEAECNHIAFTKGTDDHPEAAKAFVEKRKPAFRGR